MHKSEIVEMSTRTPRKMENQLKNIWQKSELTLRNKNVQPQWKETQISGGKKDNCHHA